MCKFYEDSFESSSNFKAAIRGGISADSAGQQSYQVNDDLVTSTAAQTEMPKTSFSDILNAKITLVIRHGSRRKSELFLIAQSKTMLDGNKKKITPSKGPGKNKEKKAGNIMEKKMRKVNEREMKRKNGKNIENKTGKKIVERKIKKNITRKRKLSEIEEDEGDEADDTGLYCAVLFSASADS